MLYGVPAVCEENAMKMFPDSYYCDCLSKTEAKVGRDHISKTVIYSFHYLTSRCEHAVYFYKFLLTSYFESFAV